MKRLVGLSQRRVARLDICMIWTVVYIVATGCGRERHSGWEKTEFVYLTSRVMLDFDTRPDLALPADLYAE